MDQHDEAVLDTLEDSEQGKIRKATRMWHCEGSDPIRKWLVRGYYGDGAWNNGTYFDDVDAEDAAESMRSGRKKASATGVPFDRVEIIEVANPNHNPGCLGTIEIGDRYFAYTAGDLMWQKLRFCARCAVIFLQGGHPESTGAF